MRLALFGASGMIGQGTLRAALADPRVEEVVAIGRTPLAEQHPKLRSETLADFTDEAALRALLDVDGVLFCLGVSAAGMSEADYRRVTFDYTLAAARALAAVRPGAAFCYVSGQGTDETLRSRMMWARVKGETENALRALPLRAYLFRPGYIQPVDGVRSRTALYNALYALFSWLYPLLVRLTPGSVTDTRRHGRALIAAVAEGGPTRVVEPAEINRLGA